jgi:hypothetical protein
VEKEYRYFNYQVKGDKSHCNSLIREILTRSEVGPQVPAKGFIRGEIRE